MNEKFKLRKTNGDIPYDVILNEVMTLEDFVEYILENNKGDWGYFYLGNRLGSPMICEYRWGKIIMKSDKYNENKKKNIAFPQALGGWARMDYYFSVVENH